MPDGSYFLNEDIVTMLNVPQSYITQQAHIQKNEIERRLQSFRGISKGEENSSSYYNDYNNFEGKTVVLVDDGIATEATILSAAQWLKTKQNCCKILIVAAPIAPPPPPPSLQSSSNDDIVSKLNQIAGKVIVLYRPELFYSVVQFYEHFEQVSDSEVKEIMKRHGHRAL
jgi:putative phosphoribosyl transferase